MEIITSLDSIYERKSTATQLVCRKRLLSLKLEGNTQLITHFSMFDEILTELLAAGAKMYEMDKMAHLITSLPNTCDSVVTAMETLDDDRLNLAFVKTRLLEYEIKLRKESNETTEIQVLNATSKILKTKNKDNVAKNNFKRHNTYNNNYTFEMVFQ